MIIADQSNENCVAGHGASCSTVVNTANFTHGEIAHYSMYRGPHCMLSVNVFCRKVGNELPEAGTGHYFAWLADDNRHVQVDARLGMFFDEDDRNTCSWKLERIHG
jgi:hypothetical protein